MHGGIWTLCIDLNGNEMLQLVHYGFPKTSKCINYLAESMEYARHEDSKYDTLHVDYTITRRSSLRTCFESNDFLAFRIFTLILL